MNNEPSIYRTSLDSENWTLIEAATRDEAAQIGGSIHQNESFYIGRFTKHGLQEVEFIDIEYKSE